MSALPRCPLRARHGHQDAAAATIQLATNTSGPLLVKIGIMGERSGRITVNLQTSPLVLKAISTVPPNWCSEFDSSRVPNPRWVGGLTGGPPLSRHSSFNCTSKSDQRIISLPSEFDSAPYFAALVTSS